MLPARWAALASSKSTWAARANCSPTRTGTFSRIGEQVLVVSGSTARKAFGREDVPMDMAIVGIVDSMEQVKH